MKPVVFLIGIGIGFVLGARAGRDRYEQIKRTATRVASSEPVQAGVHGAQRVIDDAAPRVQQSAKHLAEQAAAASKAVADRIGEGAHTIAGTVTGTTNALTNRMTSQAEDIQSRVTHTAEGLRRRSEEQIGEVRRRVGEEVERGRGAQAEGLVRAGEAREDVLLVLEDDADEMVEPGKAAQAADAGAAAPQTAEPRKDDAEA